MMNFLWKKNVLRKTQYMNVKQLFHLNKIKHLEQKKLFSKSYFGNLELRT